MATAALNALPLLIAGGDLNCQLNTFIHSSISKICFLKEWEEKYHTLKYSAELGEL